MIARSTRHRATTSVLLVLAPACANVGASPGSSGPTTADVKPATRVDASLSQPTMSRAGDASPDSADFVKSRATTTLSDGTTLAGPCVDPLGHTRAVLSGGAAPDASPPRSRLSEEGMDVDRDGTKDWLVLEDYIPFQRSYRIYVRRGDCGYYVGTVRGEGMSNADTATHGLLDYNTASSECPVSHRKHFCRAVWRFDGSQYTPSSETLIDRPPVPRTSPTWGTEDLLRPGP